MYQRTNHFPFRLRSRRILRAAQPLLASVITACLTVQPALPASPASLPSGGSFTAGTGAIVNSANGLTITQSTLRGIIDWNSFSIGKNANVSFNNGSGATLNLVNGGGISSILGSLLASGSVYLINPQGVVIGKGGRVNTNGDFVASTLSPARQAFLTGGSLAFQGASQTNVLNLGSIYSANGSVFLIGHGVTNSGSINAANGSVGLGAGSAVLLKDSTSDQRVFVQAPGGDVTNTGSIAAAAAELKAKGGNIYALAGNNSGEINATGTATINGAVWLVAEGGTTQISGKVSAQNANGSGGAVETSGAAVKDLGVAIHTGKGGSWLLDPDDLTIDTTLAGTIQTTLNGGTNVTEQTSAPTAGGQGDIIVAAPVNWTSNQTLTLDAYHGVTVNSAITSSGATGGLTIKTNDGGTGGHFTVNAPVTLASGGALTINNTPYTLITTSAGLQSLGSGYYALDANVTGPSSPLASFPGTLEGLGHSATVNINANGNTPYIGLFSQLATGATVENLLVPGTLYTGGVTKTYLGMLAGSSSATLFNVRSSGVIDDYAGGTYYGGLVGLNAGTISNSSSSVAILGGLSTNQVGGLAGQNTGSITTSFATGSVNGGSYLGGLVGLNSGSVSNSYATGAVNGGSTSNYVGGLVGQNTSFITTSYSTGAVTGTGATNIGGFVGQSSGTVASSYWDTTKSGISTQTTGATGLTTLQWLTQGPAATSAQNWNFTNTWVVGYPYPVLKTAPYILSTLSGTQTYGGSASYTVVSSLDQSGRDASGSITGTLQTVGATSASNVGTYKIGGTGQSAAGYQLTYNGSLAISPLALTISGTSLASNKVYDGTTTATVSGATLSGVLNGDSVTLAQTGLFSDKNVGTAKTVTYTDTLAGAAAGNYTLAAATGTTTANITPLVLNGGITVTTANKVYDGTTTANLSGTAAGFVAGDAVTLTAVGSFADKNVGSGKTVMYTDSLTGSSAGNYALAVSSGSTTGNITPLALTVGGTVAANKVYDGTTAASVSGGSLAGVISGDVVSFTETGSFANKNAGTGKTVNLTGSLSGSGASNYSLSATTTTANITPLVLTVGGTTVAANKVYDATPNASVSGATISGIFSGDTVALTQTGMFTDKNAGNGKTVNYTDTLTGASAANYSVSVVRGTTTANITPAGLLYTANAATGYSGSDFPGFSGTVTGLLGGDTLSANTSGSLTFTTPATLASLAGIYAINGSGLTITTGNYTLSQAASNATAFTLNAPLTTSINPFSLFWATVAQQNLAAQDSANYQSNEDAKRYVANNQRIIGVLNDEMGMDMNEHNTDDRIHTTEVNLAQAIQSNGTTTAKLTVVGGTPYLTVGSTSIRVSIDASGNLSVSGYTIATLPSGSVSTNLSGQIVVNGLIIPNSSYSPY